MSGNIVTNKGGITIGNKNKPKHYEELDKIIFENELTEEQKRQWDFKNPKFLPIIINGDKTHYIISNTGMVMNLKTHHVIKPHTDRKGYSIVNILFNGKPNTKRVHRLVAEAFIPNSENKPEINHKNGIKTDNWYGNLEWCTSKENIKHAFELGLRKIQLGENANASKYTKKQIHWVCKLLEEGKLSSPDIALVTGVDRWLVSKVKQRNCWLQISSQYNIPMPEANRVGEQAHASKYTDVQIHRVCELLRDTKYPYRIIGELTGVGLDMVYRIKIGKNWSHISSQYFTPKNKPSTEVPAQIEEVNTIVA